MTWIRSIKLTYIYFFAAEAIYTLNRTLIKYKNVEQIIY